jgi:hypothetical protein
VGVGCFRGVGVAEGDGCGEGVAVAAGDGVTGGTGVMEGAGVIVGTGVLAGAWVGAAVAVGASVEVAVGTRVVVAVGMVVAVASGFAWTPFGDEPLPPKKGIPVVSAASRQAPISKSMAAEPQPTLNWLVSAWRSSLSPVAGRGRPCPGHSGEDFVRRAGLGAARRFGSVGASIHAGTP